MKSRLYINDDTEFSLGWNSSGIVIRYRGNIRGVMLLCRGYELSYFNFEKLNSLRWNHMIRIPGKKRAIRW